MVRTVMSSSWPKACAFGGDLLGRLSADDGRTVEAEEFFACWVGCFNNAVGEQSELFASRKCEGRFGVGRIAL